MIVAAGAVDEQWIGIDVASFPHEVSLRERVHTFRPARDIAVFDDEAAASRQEYLRACPGGITPHDRVAQHTAA